MATQDILNTVEGALAGVRAAHDHFEALAGQMTRASITAEADNCSALLERACANLSDAARALSDNAKHAQIRAEKTPKRHDPGNPSVRATVWAVTDGACFYCDMALTEEPGNVNTFCVEHLVPTTAGGPNHISNFVPSCGSCNSSKGDRPVAEFLKRAQSRLRLVSGGAK